jgi:hypothetical protein
MPHHDLTMHRRDLTVPRHELQMEHHGPPRVSPRV